MSLQSGHLGCHMYTARGSRDDGLVHATPSDIEKYKSPS